MPSFGPKLFPPASKGALGGNKAVCFMPPPGRRTFGGHQRVIGEHSALWVHHPTCPAPLKAHAPKLAIRRDIERMIIHRASSETTLVTTHTGPPGTAHAQVAKGYCRPWPRALLSAFKIHGMGISPADGTRHGVHEKGRLISAALDWIYANGPYIGAPAPRQPSDSQHDHTLY